MAKVIAIWPGIYMGFDIIGKGFEQSAINHGLASISAVLKRAGHEVSLIDLRALKSWDEYESLIKRTPFDVCIMGFYSVDTVSANSALQILRKHHENKPIIVGGVHITYNELESFSVADCVVWGEGDNPIILELVQKAASGEALPRKVIAPIVKDLDSLPDIDRYLFNPGHEINHPLLPLLPAPNITVNFSRGCTNRCTFCFTGDTSIVTSHGVMEIKDIKPGMMVLSDNGSYNRVSKILHREYNGPIYRLNTSTITEKLGSTPEHPILVRRDSEHIWLPTSHICKNDYVAIPFSQHEALPIFDLISAVKSDVDDYVTIRTRRPKLADKVEEILSMKKSGLSMCEIGRRYGVSRACVYSALSFKGSNRTVPYVVNVDKKSFKVKYHPEHLNKQIRLDSDTMRLLGYYAAEGSLFKHKNRRMSTGVVLTIGDMEEDTKNDIVRVLSKHGTPYVHRNKHNHTYQIAISSIALYYMCKCLVGKYAHAKSLSIMLLEAPVRLQREFLYGYFSGDGSFGHISSGVNCLRAGTVSPSLAMNVWQMIVRLGFVPILYKGKAPKGIIQGRSVSTHVAYEVIMASNAITSKRSLLDISDFSAIQCNKNHTNFDIDKELSLVWYRVKDVSSFAYSGTVYNLEVDNTHTYVASGMVVHNCLESKNKLFRGYRIRSVERCIAELIRVKAEMGMDSMMIHDDLFPPGKWTERFIAEFSQRFPRTPFWCQMRADQIMKHPEYVQYLAQIGMTWVSLGIEGSERMRAFYNKKVSTDQIIGAADLLHKHGVNIFGNYIIGSPTETDADLEELTYILSHVRPEWHSQSTYTAYPGSALYDYCIDNDLFVGDGKSESDYYSMQRFPYHRKVKGIDYDRLNNYWGPRMSAHKSGLRQYTATLCVNIPEYLKSEINKVEVECQELEIPAPKEIMEVLIPAFSVATQPCKACLNKPKVSIIMTSYNRPKMAAEAIQSVMNQTMREWELIIVDDCSTNKDVMPMLKKAAKTDPRIRLFQVNYDVDNISVEWNLGIEKARGEYIALLDDDNHKLPDFCKKMSEYLDAHPEKDAVACYNKMIDGDGKPRGDIFDAPSKMTPGNILLKNHVDSGCMMWRRSVMDQIGWFDERLKTTEDWDFVIRLVYESNGFGIIEEPLAEYRWHKENRTFVARDLGLKLHRHFITDVKPYGRTKSVTIFHQNRDKMTLSQQNVLDGIIDAFHYMSSVNTDVSIVDVEHVHLIGRCDYIFVFAPFLIDPKILATLKPACREMMHFHCEDPQALHANLKAAKYADFISTNDMSAVPYLETVVGKGNVAYCPSISFNDAKLLTRDKVKIARDVAIVGYPYGSRVEFMKQLLPMLKAYNLSYVMVGDTWKEHFPDAVTMPTLGEKETLELMEESRTVLLMNRRNTDGGGSDSIHPVSIVRGYFEAASGSIIMIDRLRLHHHFRDLILHYDSPADVIKLIQSAKHDHKRIKGYYGDNLKDKALTAWTYRNRIRELFNIFRNRRFFQEVE